MRLVVLLGVAVASCGIAFSPGDYGGQATPAAGTPHDGGPAVDATPTVDGAGPPVDAGPPPPERHLLVFASQGEDSKGNAFTTNDVWFAPLDESGEIGTFGYMQSAPLRATTFGGTIADGALRIIAQGTSRIIENAELDGGITSAWRASPVATKSSGSFGVFFARASYVAVGGDSQQDDGTGTGTTITVYDDSIFVAPSTDAGYPTVTTSTTKLPTALTAVQTVTYGDFAYLWGDNGTGDGQRAQVYVGKVDAALGVTSIAATKPMVAQGKTYAPTAPIACAGEGHLFVAGGNATATVIVANIDQATGALGGWKDGPPLPGNLRGSGCAVWNGALHLLGGIGADGHRTAAILRSRFTADGSMASWEMLPQSLLAPRSSVLALTY